MAVNVSLLNANTIENINTNFNRIKTAMQDSVSRSGVVPNFITGDLDLNTNDVLNVGRIDVQEFYMDGQPVASLPAFEAIIDLAPQIVIVANISDEIIAVANNPGNINVVGSNIDDVITVAAIAPGIQFVIDNEAELDTIIDALPEIGIVASNITSVNTVAANIVNVNSVALNIANVNTVASNNTDINTVVANLTAINAAPAAASAAATSAAEAAASAASINPAGLTFSVRAIGELYIADFGETGVAIPPSAIVAGNTWVELTAGLTGSGQFNENKLSGESVTGSAPNINATANVAIAGSPMNGSNIELLNTTRRFMRPGSPGTRQANDNLSHGHTGNAPAHTHGVATHQSSTAGASGPNVGASASAAAVGTKTTSSDGGGALTINNSGGTEARPNNIGARIFRKVG